MKKMYVGPEASGHFAYIDEPFFIQKMEFGNLYLRTQQRL
jgi:hypothetical protein